MNYWSLTQSSVYQKTICLWLGPPWFTNWFSFTLACSRISHEYSSLFIIVINFLCSRFDALTELGAFMRTEFSCMSTLRVASGPMVKLASCKSALNHPVVYSTDHSKAVVPVLVLLSVVVYSTRRFVLCLTLCYFVLVFFSPFNTAITLLGEERANLSAFRTFIRFALVWFCLFPLHLGVWEGLRFVIVALPGLFSYFFYLSDTSSVCSKTAYSNISKTIQTRLRDMQDSWLSKKADGIQSFADRKDMKEFFYALMTVYGPQSSGTTPLLSAVWTSLLTDEEAISKRWAEHFDGGLNRPSFINDEAIKRLP